MLLVAIGIILLGFIIGLNHCAYRLDKVLSTKPAKRAVATTGTTEPVGAYARK